MAIFQYRITVNGAESEIISEYPAATWTRIAQTLEDRGGVALLERRSVFTEPVEGAQQIGNNYVFPWRYEARIEVR